MNIDSRLLFCNCLGVFQGGGVKAIAYAGAFEEAKKAGIGFSHVAGTSAGAIFAALIAAGASPEKILEIARSEEIKKIPVAHIKESCSLYLIWVSIVCIIVAIAYWIANGHSWFWCIFVIALLIAVHSKILVQVRNFYLCCKRRFGYHDSSMIAETVDNWLHEVMGKGKEEVITFDMLPIDLTIFSCNVNQKRVFRWSKHDPSVAKLRVADAVAASCSIPIYFSPTKINNDFHVDGGLLINRPNRIHSSLPNYYQALSFQLKTIDEPIKTLRDYLSSLLLTIVDGPESLRDKEDDVDNQIYGHDGVNDVDLTIENVSATSFDKLSPEIVERLIVVGREGFRNFIEKIDYQIRIRGSKAFSVSSNRTLSEIDYVHNQVAFWSYDKNDSILISDVNLDWVWPLFPTLLSWINNHVRVAVKFSSEANNGRNVERMEAQLRLLRSLGIEPDDIEANDLIRGYFFRNDKECKCILLDTQETSGEPKLLAKVYNSGLDSIFVSQILDKICEQFPSSPEGKVTLIAEDPSKFAQTICLTDAYRDREAEGDERRVKACYREVRVEDLHFVKREIRSLKFKELRIIDTLYDDARVQRYSPAALILPDGNKSMMTPIIVEEHNGRLIAIKGNARCYKAYTDNGLEATVPVFIVHNPPAINRSEFFKITDLLLSEKKNRGAGQIIPNRAIDQAFRPDSNYLKDGYN